MRSSDNPSDNDVVKPGHTSCFPWKVNILYNCTAMIDGQNFLDFSIGQGDDYATGCLLDYPYFKEHYQMIAIDLNN